MSKRTASLFLILALVAGVALWRLYQTRLDAPAQRHSRLAKAARARGEAAEAAREWMIAGALDPRFVEARLALGDAYLEDGKAALAIREFQAASQLDPRRQHVYCRLAEALRLGQLLNSGLAMAHHAVKVEPKCSRAHRVLGNLLSDRQDYTGAVRELNEAARLDPSDSSSRLASARLLLGLNNSQQAEKLAREAMALGDKKAESASVLGHILVSAGKYDSEAEQLLAEALAAQPSNSAVRFDMARVQLKRKGPAAARRELDSLVRDDPTNREALQLLADVLLELGDTSGAGVMRRRAAEVARDDLKRLELERKLVQTPNDGLILFQLGDLYGRNGQYLRSIQLLEQAKETLYSNEAVVRRLKQVREEARRAGTLQGGA